MVYDGGKSTSFDFIGAFEQAWIQYKSNFFKLLPFGILASLPPTIIFYSLELGLPLTFFFEGVVLMFLSDVISHSSNSRDSLLSGRLKKQLPFYFKNGVIISIILTPLLLLSSILLFPGVLFLSFFIFTFAEIVNRRKFSIDAMMESLRLGYGYRLHLFLLSLILFIAIGYAYLVMEYLTNGNPLFFLGIMALFLPYYFIVVEEIFEQLERK